MAHRLTVLFLSVVCGWSASLVSAQTYTAYSDIGPELLAIETAYPGIAKRYNVGSSEQGRTLWAIRISDNVAVEEDEPEIRLVSTMHGDEIVGVEMCLNLIEYLTSNYGSVARVTDLVDSTDIYIMPLMNPDGYDRASRTRTNANGVDLNRNFPDPFSSPSNTTAGRAAETAVVMNWGFANSFTLAANFHGGALLVNYPYDNNASGASVYTASPDDDLFIYISKQYSQHNAPMWNSSAFPDGITNGADWYAIDGGMQDWNYRYMHCFAVTIELSNVKEPSASQIATFWAQNRDSMLAYMETSLIGVRGVVTDGATGLPLEATIAVAGRETQNVLTDPDVGDYHRMLLPGTYDLTFTAAGYDAVTIEDVVVNAGAATRLDVVLGEGPPRTQDLEVVIIGSDTIVLPGNDPNGDPFAFVVTSLPQHGDLTDLGAGAITSVPYTLVGGDNALIYTVTGDYTGPDSFNFKATDYGTPPGGGDSNISTVGITVYAPPPEIVTASLPDGGVSQTYGPVALSAVDGQPPLSWSLVTETTYVESDLGSSLFSETGVSQGWQGDDVRWEYTLPFSFPFYGNEYTDIRVWSNGFIDFGTFHGINNYSNSDSTLIDNLMIAPMWDDLRTNVTGGDVWIDAAVPGEVTIRWVGQTYTDAHPVRFAATLVDDGTIRFHYGPENATMSATVGISNGDGAQYTLSMHNPASSLTYANSVEFTVPPTMPPGLYIAPSGEIGGVPTLAGDYLPRFRVTDAIGRTDDVALPLAVLISLVDGDYDNDGNVDLADFAAFQSCYGGTGAACGESFDFDNSGMVDTADMMEFNNKLSGP